MARPKADAALQQVLPWSRRSLIQQPQNTSALQSCCQCFLVPVAKAKPYPEMESIMQTCHRRRHAHFAGSRRRSRSLLPLGNI